MHRSFLVMALLATPLLAQDNPLATEVQQAWGRTMRNAVAAAEAMPEDKYDYKPTPESMSFRDLVAHTADSAMGACSGYMGEMRRAGAKDMTKKADLVGAMKAAAAECEKAYGSFKDAQASDMIEGRRGKRSRIGTLYGNVIHIEHEYAQMAVHLRANGVVPPSSAGRR
ncbi:MAG: DinB family protein [Bryobacterales bacterium]